MFTTLLAVVLTNGQVPSGQPPAVAGPRATPRAPVLPRVPDDERMDAIIGAMPSLARTLADEVFSLPRSLIDTAARGARTLFPPEGAFPPSFPLYELRMYEPPRSF